MSNNILLLVARILLAVIFINSGLMKLTGISGVADYIGNLGLPMPIVVAWVVALWELLAGLAILIGFKTRIAAYALALFCVATVLVAHADFASQAQTTSFFKNLAIAGGFLALAVAGAGAFSLDGRSK